jgi:uncharacterized membrane protein YeaQ/YmgE (transglycosylase-associated protein family)
LNLEMFVTWIVVALLTSGLISLAMKKGGYGRIWDVILGVAGSGAATTLVSALDAPAEAGKGAMAIAAFVGAVFVIVLQRKIWPARTRRNVGATDVTSEWRGDSLR